MEKVHIKVNTFEGPLDLLLEMVQKRKMHINDISLAHVTDSFLDYVRTQNDTDTLNNLSYFITIAATLILIKSRSLLPSFQLTEEEEQSIDDLKQQLVRYQIYQQLGKIINERFLEYRYFITSQKKPITKNNVSIFQPTPACTCNNFEKLITSLVQRRIQEKAPELREKLPEERVRVTIALEHMMQGLLDRVHKIPQTSFFNYARESLSAHAPHITSQQLPYAMKTFLVVGFLALLEAVHKHEIMVEQQSLFSDITISKV